MSENSGDRSLVRIASSVAPASILVQVFSFGSSIALATQLGATDQTDAYYLALSVPILAYGILVAALRLGAIPALTDLDNAESGEAFSLACSQVVTATFVASIVLSVVLTFLTALILPPITGASQEVTELTRRYLVELAPYAVTGALLGVLGAILAVKKRFVAAILVLSFEPVLKTVLLVTVGHQLEAQALIIGNLAGNFLAVGMLWILLRRERVLISLRWFSSSPVVRSIAALSIPLMVSQGLLSVNPLVDRGAAAGLAQGSVTVFELGVRLFSVPTSLLTGMLIAPLAATWSARFAENGWTAITDSLGKIVRAIALLVPPCVVICVVLRQELVGIVYRGGMYSVEDVTHTANVFGMLLVGLIAQILIVAFVTLFIVRRHTTFPMLVGIANFVLNASLDVALRGTLGVVGIALSTTVTLSLLCAVLGLEARRRWGPLGLGAVGRPVLLSTVSGILTGLAAAVLQRNGIFQPSRLGDAILVVSAAVLGVAIHFFLLTICLPLLVSRPTQASRWSVRAVGELLRG